MTKSEQLPGPAGEERPAADPTVQAQPGERTSDSIEGAELLRILEGDQRPTRGPAVSAPAPRIRRMPEGIEVVEERVALAVGQWVLRVRCQCGRSWFEVEEVHWATCPRCSQLVRVNVEAAGSPK